LHDPASLFGVIPESRLFTQAFQLSLFLVFARKVKDSPATAGVFVEEPLFFLPFHSYDV
jgi:hypothetical protein